MFFKYCWKAFVWALFIMVISTLPGKDIPEVDIHNADKVVHFFIYAILGYLLIMGFFKQTTFPSLRCFACSSALLFCSLYGGVLELIQHYFILDRTGDWFDFIANSTSVLLVSAFCAIKYNSL